MAAYRALARRGPARIQSTDLDRPVDELVLIYVGYAWDMPAVLDLAERLVQHRPQLTILVCVSDDVLPDRPKNAADGSILWIAAPDEHPRTVDAFVTHWKPDLVLWIRGNLRPSLIDDLARTKVPLHLVSADKSGFDGRRERWLPELTRSLLAHFTTISAQNTVTAQEIERLGIKQTTIQTAQKLQVTGRVLPCAPSDLDEVTDHLSGRPLWLAANMDAAECPIVLAAHRAALRSAHRMLLILYPVAGCDIDTLCKHIEAADLTYAIWGNGEFPEETTQVLIADLPDELGLWYRLATVSFLGSSLIPGGQGCDPMEAAALGTAILYGPNVGAYLSNYTRLASVGAARIVNDATSLSNAVGRLIIPYQAATMAHAGWDVVSEGAEVMDRIITLVQDDLDLAFENRTLTE